MTGSVQACHIPLGSSLRDALQSLELSGFLIVLVEDELGRVVGVLTDGDVRRAVLKGVALADRIDGHVQEQFTWVGPEVGRAEVLDLMQSRRIGQIPILTSDRRFVGLHTLHGILGADVRPNWAVVMAGGRGERLRPLTDLVPKPMVRVAGRPILERLIMHLVGFGIRRVFIAALYKSDAIERHFRDGAAFGCTIEYLREERPLGTGGALSLLPSLPSDPMLVLNGDLLTQCDLAALLESHRQAGNVVTVGVSQYRHTVPFGVIQTEGDRIVALDEKPTHAWEINAGIYVLEPHLVKRVPTDSAFQMPMLLDQCLAAGERVGAYRIEDDWIDVGRREELDRARGAQVTS